MRKNENNAVPLIKLNIGNTWDYNLLDELQSFRDQFRNGIQVTEIYGSLRDDPIGSARPDYRIPVFETKQLPSFIEKAHEIGLKVNYAANIFCFGNLTRFCKKIPEIKRHLQFLQSVGVDRVTLSHPFLMELVSNETAIPIEVSTICHIESISQIQEFIERFRIDKICVSIYRNRDIAFLSKAQEVAQSGNAEIELIANEFCNTNGSPCIYRDSCYLIHGHGGNQAYLLDRYPMGKCMRSRNTLGSWLKGMFILPEDIKRYQSKTGINLFKITGRTHPTPAMLKTTEYYLRQKSPENLLDLWVHLENIGHDWGDFVSEKPYMIPTHKLLENGFTDRWLVDGFRCQADCNGPDGKCAYCEDFLSKFIQQ